MKRPFPPAQRPRGSSRRRVALIAVLALIGAGPAAAAVAAPAYRLVGSVPLGSPDRWDYVVFDAPTQRVYVAHGDRLAVVDAKALTLAGQVEGVAGGTHGTGISVATGQGFTDDGRAGLAVAFDLKTLAVTRQTPVDKDADGIAVDALTGHVFIVEGDPQKVAVLDPRTGGVTSIDAGEKLEYAVADGQGAIYAAGEEKRDLVKIDARTDAVVARWSTPDCASPHGLAMDPRGRRLFMSCLNGLLMVVDARGGRVVAQLPIGRGSDAVAFDPSHRRVFSSNGADGTLSVFQQVTPDHYRQMETIPTAISGRTMAADPATGRLFIAAADTDPSPTPGGRAKPRHGTLRLLVFAPAD